MNPQRKKYILKVEKDDELSLRHLAKISRLDSVMRPAYEQAVRALMRILRDTEGFHQDSEDLMNDPYELNDRLFWYSGNIIAFNATRGGGKTVSMRSFAQTLRSGFVEREGNRRSSMREYRVDNSFLPAEDRAWLERCRFIPMTALEPAMLEQEQNILSVVFSRLRDYTERLLEKSMGADRFMESQKNELIRSINKVRSGINGIKHPGKEPLEDLSALQDISDGLSLRKHFHTLVQNILRFSAPGKDSSERYLVLLLDDADFKTEKAYEVLEDVRKYLMIPNLVILMSVDKDCLYNVILQDNLKKFPDLLKLTQKPIMDDVSRVTSKYISKLIPPTHLVVLPRLDECVRSYGNQLDLCYCDADNRSVLDWKTGDDWDLQTTFLMLIYRKTGVLFVKPRTYMHNFIPRMLRDLVQLLWYLNQMRDIPVLDIRKYQSVAEYCEALLEQVDIAEANLRLFSEYVLSTWMDARINNYEDRHFLKKLGATAGNNRVRLAYQYLVKKYPEYDNDDPVYSRVVLHDMMWSIERYHRSEEDFALIFAIRMLFSLHSHKEILKIKREGALAYLHQLDQQDPDIYPILAFDFNPDLVFVPKEIQLYDMLAAWMQKCSISESLDAIIGTIHLSQEELDEMDEGSGLEWLPSVADEAEEELYEFSALNLLTMALRLAYFKGYYRRGRGSLMEQQNAAYRVQEIAVALYANSDVQLAVEKWLAEYMKKKYAIDAELDAFEIWNQLSTGISSLMRSINRSKVGDYRPDLTELLWDEDSFGIFQVLFDEIPANRPAKRPDKRWMLDRAMDHPPVQPEPPLADEHTVILDPMEEPVQDDEDWGMDL